MPNAVLDVQDVPNLLVSKFHSNTFSWREENGALLFQPAEDGALADDTGAAAFEELKKFRGALPKDFDYKKARLERLDEKYGSLH